MHLKAIQQMSSKVPRSIGVPPLSDPRFEQAVMAGAAELVASTSVSGSASHVSLSTPSPSTVTTTMMTTSEIQLPRHHNNNNGLQSMGATTVCSSPCYSSSSLSSSVFPSSSGYHHHHDASGQIRAVDHDHDHDDVDDDSDNNNNNNHQEQNRIRNPLSGMGLTDEQYTMILQNIVNADGSTMHGPANPNLNLTGMISSSMAGGGGGGGRRCGEKRGYEESGLDSSLNSRKKSRFEVIE